MATTTTETKIQETFKLNNNYEIPSLIFGTAGISPINKNAKIKWDEGGDKLCEAIIYKALLTGYRAIDTAWGYQNELQVGNAVTKAIKDGVVKREEVFITTKLFMIHYRAEHVARIFETMLQKLQVEYIDLLLMHWPVAFEYHGDDNPHPGRTSLMNVEEELLLDQSCDLHDTMNAIKLLVKSGKLRSWGVSNFNTEQVKAIMEKHTDCPPSVLQDPLNPYYPLANRGEQQMGLVQESWGASGGWTSLFGDRMSNPTLSQHPKLIEIAKAHNVATNIICYVWVIRKGRVAIAATTSEAHLIDNWKGVHEVELSQDEMDTLDSLCRSNAHLCFSDTAAKQMMALDKFKWQA